MHLDYETKCVLLLWFAHTDSHKSGCPVSVTAHESFLQNLGGEPNQNCFILPKENKIVEQINCIFANALRSLLLGKSQE